MSYNAKAVYLTVAGIEINVVVFNIHFNLLMEALLKKVFKTVRTVDIDWPDAEAIYKQARQEIETEATPKTGLVGTTAIKSVWYKSLSKSCTVLCAKARVNGDIRTVLHNRTFTPTEAHKLCAAVKLAGKIDLSHWRL